MKNLSKVFLDRNKILLKRLEEIEFLLVFTGFRKMLG